MENSRKILNEEIIGELRDMGEDFFAEIIEKFYEDADQDIAELQRCVAESDAKGLGIAAHGIKGTSLTMGAERLAAIALEIELMGKENNLENIDDCIERLCSAYSQTRDALDARICTE